MIGRRAALGTGWQVMLADLALILFMVSASALDRAPVAEAQPVALPRQGEPVAIWRDGPSAPPLAQWIAGQPRDGRLQLTIIARGDQPPTRALQLLQAAPGARLVVEPGEDAAIFAVLAYDRPWHDACSDGDNAKGSSPCA